MICWTIRVSICIFRCQYISIGTISLNTMRCWTIWGSTCIFRWHSIPIGIIDICISTLTGVTLTVFPWICQDIAIGVIYRTVLIPCSIRASICVFRCHSIPIVTIGSNTMRCWTTRVVMFWFGGKYTSIFIISIYYINRITITGTYKYC